MASKMLARPHGFRVVARGPRLCRAFSTVLDTPVFPVTPRSKTPKHSSVFNDALNATSGRTNWTKEEISEVYNTSLIDLTYASVRQTILTASGSI
jgi:biotin synthase